MTTDELVNQWALEQFRRETQDWKWDNRMLRHLRECQEAKVVWCHHEWGCGCYSEYTRDDEWRITARLECPHEGKDWQFLEVRWGNLPEILEELRRLDAEGFECRGLGEDEVFDPDA